MHAAVPRDTLTPWWYSVSLVESWRVQCVMCKVTGACPQTTHDICTAGDTTLFLFPLLFVADVNACIAFNCTGPNSICVDLPPFAPNSPAGRNCSCTSGLFYANDTVGCLGEVLPRLRVWVGRGFGGRGQEVVGLEVRWPMLGTRGRG